MLSTSAKIMVKMALTQRRGAEKKLQEAQAILLRELRRAKEEGATYHELAMMVGVSRQRVHQMIKGE